MNGVQNTFLDFLNVGYVFSPELGSGSDILIFERFSILDYLARDVSQSH